MAYEKNSYSNVKRIKNCINMLANICYGSLFFMLSQPHYYLSSNNKTDYKRIRKGI